MNIYVLAFFGGIGGAVLMDITESFAARLGLTSGVNVVRADSPAEWKERLLELWRDPARCAEMGSAGRTFVETHHSWDQCLRPFSRLLGLSENL